MVWFDKAKATQIILNKTIKKKKVKYTNITLQKSLYKA
jgi:hypothetical protein